MAPDEGTSPVPPAIGTTGGMARSCEQAMPTKTWACHPPYSPDIERRARFRGVRPAFPVSVVTMGKPGQKSRVRTAVASAVLAAFAIGLGIALHPSGPNVNDELKTTVTIWTFTNGREVMGILEDIPATDGVHRPMSYYPGYFRARVVEVDQLKLSTLAIKWRVRVHWNATAAWLDKSTDPPVFHHGEPPPTTVAARYLRFVSESPGWSYMSQVPPEGPTPATAYLWNGVAAALLYCVGVCGITVCCATIGGGVLKYRRQRRFRRQSRCVECGYPILPREPCPECGFSPG